MNTQKQPGISRDNLPKQVPSIATSCYDCCLRQLVQILRKKLLHECWRRLKSYRKHVTATSSTFILKEIQTDNVLTVALNTGKCIDVYNPYYWAQGSKTTLCRLPCTQDIKSAIGCTIWCFGFPRTRLINHKLSFSHWEAFNIKGGKAFPQPPRNTSVKLHLWCSRGKQTLNNPPNERRLTSTVTNKNCRWKVGMGNNLV